MFFFVFFWLVAFTHDRSCLCVFNYFCLSVALTTEIHCLFFGGAGQTFLWLWGVFGGFIAFRTSAGCRPHGLTWKAFSKEMARFPLQGPRSMGRNLLLGWDG